MADADLKDNSSGSVPQLGKAGEDAFRLRRTAVPCPSRSNKRPQFGKYVFHRTRPIGGFFGQTSIHNVAQRIPGVWQLNIEVNRPSRERCRDGIRETSGSNGRPFGEEKKENAANPVDVRARRQTAESVAKLLRREEARRARGNSKRVTGNLAEAEICEYEVTVVSAQKISWRQVAMDDPTTMRSGDSFAKFLTTTEDLSLIHI